MKLIRRLLSILGLIPMSLHSVQNPNEQALSDLLDADLKVFFSTAAPPTEHDLREFEAFVGYRLPADFRELHKTKHGSFYVEAKESIRARHKEGDVAPFWSFLYGFYIMSLSSDAPDWMNIVRWTEEFRKESGTDLTPFLRIVGDADVYCFNHSGDIVRWDHELAEAKPVRMSFAEVVRFELKELVARKNRKKETKPAQPASQPTLGR
jgi:hypothetical protein